MLKCRVCVRRFVHPSKHKPTHPVKEKNLGRWMWSRQTSKEPDWIEYIHVSSTEAHKSHPRFFRLKFYSYQDINLYSLFFIFLFLLLFLFIIFSKGFEIVESYCFAMVKEKDYLMNEIPHSLMYMFSLFLCTTIISTLVF